MAKIARIICHSNLNFELNWNFLDEMLCRLRTLDPNGVPQLLQTNRPARERSALNILPPQQLQDLELIKSYNRVHNKGYQRKNRNASKRNFRTEGER